MDKNQIAQKLCNAINDKNMVNKIKRTQNLKNAMAQIQMLVIKPLVKAMAGLGNVTKESTLIEKAQSIVKLLKIEDGSLEKTTINDINFHINQLKLLSEGIPLDVIKKEVNSIDGKYEFQIDEGANFYSIVSNQIKLEDINLGRFRAGFKFFGNEIEFEAEALEPNPCDDDQGTTHPHVRDNSICMGDGYHIAVQAIKEGRIEDAFDIILSVLNTYSKDDAYHRLEEWNGYSCHGCGTICPEEDCCHCANCGSTNCMDCSTFCDQCEDSKCNRCLNKCNGCGDRHCCLESCEDCGYDFCSDCLEEGVCNSCFRTCQLCEERYASSNFVDCESCRKECCENCTEICKIHNKPCCNKCIRECLECRDCLCEESISILRFCETCQEEKEANEAAKN